MRVLLPSELEIVATRCCCFSVGVVGAGAMPSNDVMNDSSFIDEGTFMDRDWTWSFNALWNKKSAERCRVNIADTVFVSGGEPSAWMFTAKVRDLLRGRSSA